MLLRFYAALMRRVSAPVRSVYLQVRIREMKNRLDKAQPAPRHPLAGHLIVSLTSYPPRFPQLHLTLMSLLTQDTAPDKLILWLADKDYASLPPDVLALRAKGLEIRTCIDTASYKKIVPCVEAFPESFIVTADDDIYYPPGWLASLCRNWNGDPHKIICHRAHRITFKGEAPKPYIFWKHKVQGPQSGPDLFATSGAGVLYPPGCFAADMTRHDIFAKLCPRADDVWLYWMIRLSGHVYSVTNFGSEVLNWDGTQDVSLLWENVADGGNDRQITAMIEKYGFPQY